MKVILTRKAQKKDGPETTVEDCEKIGVEIEAENLNEIHQKIKEMKKDEKLRFFKLLFRS